MMGIRVMMMRWMSPASRRTGSASWGTSGSRTSRWDARPARCPGANHLAGEALAVDTASVAFPRVRPGESLIGKAA